MGAAMILANCGAPGDLAIGMTWEKETSPIRTPFQGNLASQPSARAFLDEQGLRSNPECLASIPSNLEGVIQRIVDRFNISFQSGHGAGQVQLLHGDARALEGNVALMACGGGDATAFSHGRTAAISMGLISILKESAESDKLTDLAIGESPLSDTASPDTMSRVDPARVFESALAFIIYHELGHIYLGHTMTGDGYTSNVADCCAMETQADLFAASAIKKAGYLMDGANLVFNLLERTNPDGSLAHPGPGLRFSRIHTAP